MGAPRARAVAHAATAFLVLLVCSVVVIAMGSPSSSAAVPQQVTFTLLGCNRPVGLALPAADGRFVCPDAYYTPGNQGPNWSELDLVPFRMTAKITPAQTFTIGIAAANRDGSRPGYDLISEPVLNAGLSDPSCRQPAVQATQTVNNIGGFDVTLVRLMDVPSLGNETCTYDWYQRLAVGSSAFPGASLDTRLVNEDFNNQGIGQKTVSIPVKDVEPQSLSKQISASRGDGFLWSLTKSNVPATVGVDSCAPGAAGSFTTTIRWSRTPVTGAVSWTTQVFANNPSSRTVSVRVTDVVSAAGQVVDTTTGQAVAVPGGSTRFLVLSHTGTAPASASSVSDTATATYVDTETGAPVAGNTTATASTPVTVKAPGNATATITDVTTASQPVALTSVSTGTTDVALGTPVSTPITWSSGTVSGSGSATLAFSVPVARGFGGTATVTDTATLVDSAGTPVTTSQEASITGLPSPARLTFVKTVDVPPIADATFDFSLWVLDATGQRTTTDPVLQGPVVVPAGASSSTSVELTVPPSAFGYEFEEDPAPGYAKPPTGTLPPLGVCDSLAGTIANTRLTGTIQVTKTVVGDLAGADPTATVHVDCAPGVAYDQDLVVAPGAPAETGPIPTGVVCQISEPVPPDGFELVGISPDRVTVTAGPTPVAVTVTNRRTTGQLRLTKVLNGNPAGASTTFTAHVDCAPDTTYDRTIVLTVDPPATEATSAPIDVPTGVVCTVTEGSVPGWALSSITPDGGVVTIAPGPNDVTLTNTRVRGSLVVIKRALGPIAGAATSFTVQVACSNGFSVSRVLDAGAQGSAFASFEDIPAGTTCAVTEPSPPPGWSRVGIEPATVTIGSDPANPASVTVTNRRDTGAIHVVKRIVGDVAGAPTDFTVNVACPDIDLDQDVRLSIPDAPEADVAGIPTGVSCAVSEANPGPAWTVSGVPTTVTAGDSPVTVTVTNTRNTGAIRVIKRLEGSVAGASTAFVVHLSCPDAGIDEDIMLNDANQHTVTRSGIPTGVTCTVTESEVPPGWALQAIEPDTVDPGRVRGASESPAEVTVTNRRLTGGIAITKTLVGPVDGAPTTFSAFLDCDGTDDDQDVTVTATQADPGTALIDGIPVGVHCTFTEINIPGQWSLGGVASPDVTIDSTDPVQVHAVNTRRTGDLTVVKQVQGAPATTDLTFGLRLDCSDDVFDIPLPVDVPAGSGSVSETFSGIPTGVTCRVDEPAPPAGWELVSVTPGSVTIGDQPSKVTALNRRAAVLGTPQISTRTSKSRVTPGRPFSDQVSISGLLGQAGVLATARLYGPFSSPAAIACTAPHLAQAVSWQVRNGTSTSPHVRVRAPGYYGWQVSTSSNSSNRAGSHPCGLDAETTVVAKRAYVAPAIIAGFSGTIDAPGLERRAPAVVRMPAIGLSASVFPEGIRGGHMTLPSDVADVGWLRRSAGVGDAIGVTVIAGHVSDRHDRPGAMNHLDRAHRGQRITITRGGVTHRFKVIATATFDRGHRLPHRYFTTLGRHRLVLVSCTDRVVHADGRFHYTRYQVVLAAPVQSQG